MERYCILYRIAVNHDYFNGIPCTALQCRFAPQGELLARQRNLLFRQTAADRWDIFYDSAGAGPDVENDVLALEISIIDPCFALYTEWKNFRPMASYVLELSQKEEQMDVASVIRSVNEKRKVGTPFCSILLRLTDQLLETAKGRNPTRTLLCFHAPEVQWEYLFLPRGESSFPSGGLVLEDTTGKLEFSAFEKCEAYGRTAWRTVSKGHIPMRMNYEYHLRLVMQNEGRQRKRILLARVGPPEPGRYQSGQTGVIRQVCYY